MSAPGPKMLLAVLASVIASASACMIGVGNFAGKTCQTSHDCPDPYVCVFIRPNLGRTCELLSPPETITAGGGVPISYCQVRATLNKSCVANCHDRTHTYPGTAPFSYFRLDAYASDGGAEFRLPDGGQMGGAKSVADRVRIRTQTATMPPLDFSPQPTREERDLIVAWAAQGAPFLVDGGVCDGG